MDQMKIGELLRKLRNEKHLSQEQLAEKLNVSSRSVSRWENGNTMPDISLIIELADFYDIDIRELLNGERKSEKMDKDMKETLDMVSDYSATKKNNMVKGLLVYIGAIAIIFCALLLINFLELININPVFDRVSIGCMSIGFVYSICCIGKIMQINDKIDKDLRKKLKISALVVGILSLVFSILVKIFLVNV